jgi:hypothetical protein
LPNVKGLPPERKKVAWWGWDESEVKEGATAGVGKEVRQWSEQAPHRTEGVGRIGREQHNSHYWTNGRRIQKQWRGSVVYGSDHGRS